MALIMGYAKEHKELPGKKTIPVWLPTDLPEGWSWKPRSKARPRSENQLQHWMLATKSNCRVAFWHREVSSDEVWSLCSTRASQTVLTVMRQALDNYRNVQFDEELAAGLHK